MCEPIWHVSYRSSEAFANCYTRLVYFTGANSCRHYVTATCACAFRGINLRNVNTWYVGYLYVGGVT